MAAAGAAHWAGEDWQAMSADDWFDPNAALRMILSQNWLGGAICSVCSALLACLGLILQKKAQYVVMGDKVGPNDPKPGWGKLVKLPLFWCGVGLIIAQGPMSMVALKYAPETTVTPINTSQVFFNFFLSFGLLYERFSKRDVTATIVCLAGIFSMSAAIPRLIPSYEVNFPLEEALQSTMDMFVNVGFASYLLVWVVLFAICLYMISNVSMQNVVKPLAWPILVGLLYSLCHFMEKIGWTLLTRGRSDPQVWSHPFAYPALMSTFVFYAAYVVVICEGNRHFACRFYVPATVVASQALTVTQVLLFFRQWETMTDANVVVFVCACSVSIVGLFYISPVSKRLASPGASGLNSPLLSPRSSALQSHQFVVDIIKEYNIQKPDALQPAKLDLIDMSTRFRAVCRLFPLCFCVLLIGTPIVLFLEGWAYSAFIITTIFTMYQSWKLGAHITLFSYVGLKKMAHYENADFKALYCDEMRERKRGPQPRTRWDDVLHFVILPNYKEPVDILQLALKSIAASGIAKEQIGIVMAMEEREAGAQEKADQLLSEFGGQFRHFVATYHPPDLEGETPGKSANTKWAAAKVLDAVIPQNQLNIDNIVLTVADADSEFHPEYFAALTYYFIHAGGGEGEAPTRYMTIWQAPILHFKNYITQPHVVRMCSFITSQHELANLADPTATRIPYSTYSLSAVLAKGVNGWDPDWISEDWHMAIKCFFATAGKLKICPIFLAVLNYAPEGATWWGQLMARWVQAKRHALGFSEVVYFQDHFCRVFRSIKDPWDRAVFTWRACFLWVKLLAIHAVMANVFLLGQMNIFLITYFATHQITATLNINSWMFLINTVFQAMGILGFVLMFLVSALIYEGVKHRVDGADDPKLSILWRSRVLHTLTVIPQSLLVFPVFLIVAGASEWIAAFKSAFTHKFDYVVAPKKPVSANP